MHRSTPIAVVGMGGLFPKAPTLAEYWHNISHKVVAISEPPPGRWVLEPAEAFRANLADDHVVSTRGGFIDDFRIDPRGLSIDPAGVVRLDPLYHLVLHAAREAFNASVVDKLDRDRVGVVLASIALPTQGASGISDGLLDAFFEEALLGQAGRLSDIFTRYAPDNSRVTALPGALVAQALRLGGGSYTLDAACASSLYAIKFACDELRAGRADAMLAGGASRPDSLYTQMGFSQLRALSPSGRCAPFDARADGLVVGEGAGFLMLKRLEDALGDGDDVLALIRGIGLSNDISSNLLAPDAEGQLRAMTDAYAQAGWSPQDVDLIECHGTGTPLGDGVEIQSMKTLWGESGWRPGRCAIGSVKSMIGHLLTGAGLASVIKTILALRNRTLPPSANFERPADTIDLATSPFRVQTQADHWPRRDEATPRRAAVSAFGFGGINAHVLLEEAHRAQLPAQAHRSRTSLAGNAVSTTRIETGSNETAEPLVAVVGMDARFGAAESLDRFESLVFGDRPDFRNRPRNRWNGWETQTGGVPARPDQPGSYLDEVAFPIDRFRVPPNEIPEILPQQLLMLQCAAAAMGDANIPDRRHQPRVGVIVGMGFDFETTTFHYRWALPRRARRWGARLGLKLSESELERWIESLREAAGPALNPTRTVGALGNILASRIAKAFGLGGPSFVVSAEEASGLRAIELAVRALQRGEIDAALAGGVDLTGDARAVLCDHALAPLAGTDHVASLDADAAGSLPGEGAACVVLKRLDDALKNGDRVYSILRGFGNAGCRADPADRRKAYDLALKRAFDQAGISRETVGLLEAHGSANRDEDRIELSALAAFFAGRREPAALGSVKGHIGHAGAAAGMAGFVKACLCLHRKVLAPTVGFRRLADDAFCSDVRPESVFTEDVFHVPRRSSAWIRDRADGPRRAGVTAMSADGTCTHVILEEAVTAGSVIGEVAAERSRRLPAAARDRFGSRAIFAIRAADVSALREKLGQLETQIRAGDGDPPRAAIRWNASPTNGAVRKKVIAILAESKGQLRRAIGLAGSHLHANAEQSLDGQEGVYYRAAPLAGNGQIAFVFPGSGNHFVGMGSELALAFPEVVRRLDGETEHLGSQLMCRWYGPYGNDWTDGWRRRAHEALSGDPHRLIFGQVAFGVLSSDVLRHLGVEPRAVIGYSLGETAGLFALRAWTDRDEMYRRMEASGLFRTALSGPCAAARKAWSVPPDQDVDFQAMLVNRPARDVRRAVGRYRTASLLIVNTDDECVIGGRGRDVQGAIRDLGCEAVRLEGISTVHCSVVQHVAAEYRQLHLLPTTPPAGVRFYSGHLGGAYAVTPESAADAILGQALHGFDFPRMIRQAYEDGVRIFVEVGPQNSCSRMIGKILGDRPHVARSASGRSEDELGALFKLLAGLTAEGVAVDLDRLHAGRQSDVASVQADGDRVIRVPVGQARSRPTLPAIAEPQPVESPALCTPATVDERAPEPIALAADVSTFATDELSRRQYSHSLATIAAHERYLDFSARTLAGMGASLAFQARMIEALAADGGSIGLLDPGNGGDGGISVMPETEARPAFDREKCLEFARGLIGRVLGDAYAPIDDHPTRVRLPDEPLMLVDRILTVEGRPRSLGSGRVVTEHDVRPGAWYLDTDRAPTCITVEAGQADLFLSAYLGIDFVTKGIRVYRLLDATVTFHRRLPRAGETISYDIHIDRFVRQGDTYLFFFNFVGAIDGQTVLTMTDGCAGFFTHDEAEASGGIILTAEETAPAAGRRTADWRELVPMAVESYDDEAIAALRRGDLAECFGSRFASLPLSDPPRLPSGRMKLIDRVLEIDPTGGRYGLGRITAEADVHPDDWYLTCHFVDDRVMPGTLMSECCLHTLRVFLLRMGWVADQGAFSYEPVPGVGSSLRCRRPVTTETKKATYRIDVKEIGYRPEPYAIADALMSADGRDIVLVRDMSVQLTGLTRETIEKLWSPARGDVSDHRSAGIRPVGDVPVAAGVRPAVFSGDRILALAVGKPSDAFGESYRVFDSDRRVARLPGPPFLFMDRITEIHAEANVLESGGWIESQYDVPADAWYFRANRQRSMPFSVLLEIGLQPCGWLAAYLGSALTTEGDLFFRNLGGEGTLHREVFSQVGTLTVRARITNISRAADMIIQSFETQIWKDGAIVYDATTSFGFFTAEAMAQQVGLRDADDRIHALTAAEEARAIRIPLPDPAPRRPDDPAIESGAAAALPARAYRMIDAITAYCSEGGPKGLGFIRGEKQVDPDEWFFKAHFYQDPVMPGSLGLEAFLQLLKVAALQRWGEKIGDTHRFEPITVGQEHEWKYRGQVIQSNNRVIVEAVITEVEEGPATSLRANGFLQVDGMVIYEMMGLGVRLVPLDPA